MPGTYTVRRGDTLSEIAARYYGSAAAYPALWWVNKARVHDPNVIEAGQRLRLSHWHPQTAWLAAAAKKADPPGDIRANRHAGHRAVRHVHVRVHRNSGGKIWKVTYGYPFRCGDGDNDGYDEPCSAVFPHKHVRVAAAYRSSGHRSYRRSGHRSYRRSYSSGTYHGSGSKQRCIIARESGGNSQVMNSSGHYGLYQFSAQTWVASGGSAGTFGHASVAEQNRVFNNAVAARGYSDWTPYDGC